MSVSLILPQAFQWRSGVGNARNRGALQSGRRIRWGWSSVAKYQAHGAVRKAWRVHVCKENRGVGGVWSGSRIQDARMQGCKGTLNLRRVTREVVPSWGKCYCCRTGNNLALARSAEIVWEGAATFFLFLPFGPDFRSRQPQPAQRTFLPSTI